MVSRNGGNLQTIKTRLLIIASSNNGSDNNLHDQNIFLRQRWDCGKEKKLKLLRLSSSLTIIVKIGCKNNYKFIQSLKIILDNVTQFFTVKNSLTQIYLLLFPEFIPQKCWVTVKILFISSPLQLFFLCH